LKYIVDANVLSELTRPAPNAAVVEWLRDHEGDIALTPIILGEIEYGILLLGDGRQRRALQRWFADRVRTLVVLDFDSQTASAWAQLLARLKRNATPMPIKDSLIAASALQHRLAVVTRNTTDFKKAGVPLINPFES
jgi:predicted nucleic acid-binding protein